MPTGNHEANGMRSCETTGLPVCLNAQQFIKLNAVCAVVFLLIGAIGALREIHAFRDNPGDAIAENISDHVWYSSSGVITVIACFLLGAMFMLLHFNPELAAKVGRLYEKLQRFADW